MAITVSLSKIWLLQENFHDNRKKEITRQAKEI